MPEDHSKQTQFIPGLELAESYFYDIVEPIITFHLPELKYSTALIGCGSEVLGFDTEMSCDHDWGPGMMIFLRPDDLESKGKELNRQLCSNLPSMFRGYSTNFTAPDSDDTKTSHFISDGTVNYRIEIYSPADYFKQYLDINIEVELTAIDWLTIPQHKLRSVCAGRVFQDNLGLEQIRTKLSWYPHDVWLYILASCWTRIGQECHLIGRAASVGDDIGSTIIASRLVRDIMRLAFYMERDYPPYAKWFGSAFARLKSSKKLHPVLSSALQASSYKDREENLCASYKIIAEMHNELGITKPLPVEPSRFYDRPFMVIDADAFADSLKEQIKVPEVKALADIGLLGNIDLLSDNTDLLEDNSRIRMARNLYK